MDFQHIIFRNRFSIKVPNIDRKATNLFRTTSVRFFHVYIQRQYIGVAYTHTDILRDVEKNFWKTLSHFIRCKEKHQNSNRTITTPTTVTTKREKKCCNAQGSQSPSRIHTSDNIFNSFALLLLLLELEQQQQQQQKLSQTICWCVHFDTSCSVFLPLLCLLCSLVCLFGADGFWPVDSQLVYLDASLIFLSCYMILCATYII